jgi:hypothetical protein
MISHIVSQFKQATLLPLMFSGFVVVGTPAGDILSDTGKTQEAVHAQAGNDVLVYTPSSNAGHRDQYDGGAGVDVLWLRVSPREFAQVGFRADLIRFYYHIFNTGDVHRETGQGLQFHFDSMGLSVQNIEQVHIESTNTRDQVSRKKLPKSVPDVEPQGTENLV